MDFKDALNDLSGSEALEPEVVDAEWDVAKEDPFDLERLQASIEPYRKGIEELVVKAQRHIIKDDRTNITAVEMGGQLAKLKKNLEAARKDVIRPYDEIVRGINGMAKGLRDPIDQATRSIKGKIARYAAEQAEIQRRIAEKKAREEAEIRRLQMEKDRAEALERQRLAIEEAARKQAELDAIAEKEGIASVTVVAEQIEIPEEVETVVEEVKAGPTKTDAGTASVVKKWKYRIEDLGKIPEDYIIKVLDKEKVQAEIDAGVRSIPGLRIYEHSDVRIRTA